MLNILFQNLDIFSSIETANSISKKTFLIESRNKYLIKYFYKQNCENGLQQKSVSPVKYSIVKFGRFFNFLKSVNSRQKFETRKLSTNKSHKSTKSFFYEIIPRRISQFAPSPKLELISTNLTQSPCFSNPFTTRVRSINIFRLKAHQAGVTSCRGEGGKR